MSGSVRQYLEASVKARRTFGPMPGPEAAYLNFEDFVLREGRSFEWAPLPEDVEEGEIRQCFDNAWRLVREWPRRFRYVEGFAFAQLIPVLHAWCVDEDDRVVDPTWTGLPVFDNNPKEYYGVVIPLGAANECHLGRDHRSVIDDWQRRWPVLHRPWKEVLAEHG